jgi:hypothetical protein
MPNAEGIVEALVEIYETTRGIFRGKIRSESVETECYDFVKHCWRFEQPADDSVEGLCDEDYLIERLTSPPLSLTSDDASNCLAAILEVGLVQRLDIHFGNASQDKLLARPEAIIALDRLRKPATDVQEVSLNELRSIAEDARVFAYKTSVEALVDRLHGVVDMKQQARPQPKHFVFATFLLLGRMIGYSYALRLSKDKRGHFVLQEKLIEALNKLGADLLGERWAKERFVFDNFTRDLERRKTLVAFFEDSLRYIKEGEGGVPRYRYYFKVENYEQDLPKLRFIVRKLIDGLCETGMTPEEAQRRLEGVREKYLFNFPIEGVDRERLQPCKPNVDPYSNVLAQAIKEATAEHLSYLESKTSTRQLSMDLG